MPPELTRLRAQELVPIIASFEAAELSLKSQLHPENILSVATMEYLPVFERINTALHCPRCDQFWVTTSAEAIELCVLESSSSRSTVRATAVRKGFMVDAVTYEPKQSERQMVDRSTYHLLKENGLWKVARITDWEPTSKGYHEGTADVFRVLQENLEELGCP